MTRAQLNHLTVPQLRDRCRKAKLPVWQYHGVRLCKSDLVSALARLSRRKPKARKKHARKPKGRQTAIKALQRAIPLPEVQPAPDMAIVATLAEQLIARALADLPCDPIYARSMGRILRGGKAVKDRMILQRKRIVAIGTLRDGSPDEKGRAFWDSKYTSEMALGGC